MAGTTHHLRDGDVAEPRDPGGLHDERRGVWAQAELTGLVATPTQHTTFVGLAAIAAAATAAGADAEGDGVILATGHRAAHGGGEGAGRQSRRTHVEEDCMQGRHVHAEGGRDCGQGRWVQSCMKDRLGLPSSSSSSSIGVQELLPIPPTVIRPGLGACNRCDRCL